MIMEPNSLFSIIIRSFEPLSSLLLRSPLSSVLSLLSFVRSPFSSLSSLFSLLSFLLSLLQHSQKGSAQVSPPAHTGNAVCTSISATMERTQACLQATRAALTRACKQRSWRPFSKQELELNCTGPDGIPLEAALGVPHPILCWTTSSTGGPSRRPSWLESRCCCHHALFDHP